jgi:rubrerythrin
MSFYGRFAIFACRDTMLSSRFAGLAKDRKLSHEELIRAVRFMVAAEYEAVQLYMQLAESTDNKLVQTVMKDVANEERVHAGEFLKLLCHIAPDEEEFYAEGSREVEGMMEELQKSCKDKKGKGCGKK